jgi:hemolysin activation/secretion protein
MRSRRFIAPVAFAAFAVLTTKASGQSIERNLPLAPILSAPAIAPASAVPADKDATPIGPALTAIITLGAGDTAPSHAAAGVDLDRTPGLTGAHKRLQRFIGRPLSKKLIAEVEAEIVGRYRAFGRPFVSVSTPEQEVSGGVLQVRVVEFHLGAKTAPGARARDAAYIESRVRAAPGQPIDATRLSQDLDWLNRFPFRRTGATFTPGAGLGATDLQLMTTTSKPWSVYAGYADLGSPLTGEDRYFAGGEAVLPLLHDAVASYQVTTSNDGLFDKDRPFDTAADARYRSQAGRLSIPTLPRQAIEASIDYVQSNQPSQDFLIRQTTYEATLDYRSALSNLWRTLPGEAALGVELKRQTSRTLFGGVAITGASFDLLQVTLAYADQESDRWGRSSGELVMHLSPGGADGRDTDAALANFSKGRSTEAQYGYLSASFSRLTSAPSVSALAGWSLTDSLIGQYAAQPLPLTEQIGLGGAGLVRGYTLDDGAFDTGVVSRNELRPPAFAALGRLSRLADQLSPYVFIDAGYAKDRRTKADAAPVSTGVGIDYQLGSRLTASLDAAWALRTIGRTEAGCARLESRVAVTF